jgi:hypothetical protein
MQPRSGNRSREPSLPAARLERAFAAVAIVSFCCFAIGWFSPASSVGVGDWDQFFSYALVSARGLVERRWPPLWSIQLAGGAPLAGDPQTLGHSPLLLLPVLFGPIVGTKLLVVLLIGAGFAGCYRLGLRWIGDAMGAAVFAFVFVFSGHFAIHLRVGHFPWAAFHLIPWILVFADRLLRDPTVEARASLGLVACAVLLLSGMVYHPLVFFLLPVAAVYAFVYARHAPRDRIRHVGALVLCAAAVTTPRWLPILEWELRNPRVVPGGGGMPLARIAGMLLFPIDDYKLRVAWGASGVWEYWSYVGIVGTALAVASLRRGGPGRSFTVGCFLLGVVLAWRGPWGSVLGWIAPYVPFLSSVRVYSRFLVLAVFAIALSAGREVASLRVRGRGMLGWVPTLMLAAVLADYSIVTRSVWSNVFALDAREAYADWGLTLREARYSTVRSAPPYQPSLSPTQDMFNSRMLPLLMAGAVVRNAYVTPALPWSRPAEGNVIEGIAPDGYRLTNHQLELFGDLHAGQQIRIKLRYSRKDWTVTDRTAARIDADAGGMKLVILRPCSYVRVAVRPGLETPAWIVSLVGLASTLVAVRRRPRQSAPTPS